MVRQIVPKVGGIFTFIAKQVANNKTFLSMAITDILMLPNIKEKALNLISLSCQFQRNSQSIKLSFLRDINRDETYIHFIALVLLQIKTGSHFL